MNINISCLAEGSEFKGQRLLMYGILNVFANVLFEDWFFENLFARTNTGCEI